MEICYYSVHGLSAQEYRRISLYFHTANHCPSFLLHFGCAFLTESESIRGEEK